MSKTSLGEMLAQKLNAKAKLLGVASLPLLEWGAKYVPHYFPLPFNKAHYKLQDIVESFKTKRKQKVVVRIPRGYAKSTIVSFLTALKALCEGTEPYILLGSETDTLAKKYLANIKTELEFNEKLRADYPLACVEPVVWNAERIELRNKTCCETFGKGTGVRGSRFGEHRPTLVIVDDPQKDDDVNSPTTRETDYQWVLRTLMPVKGPNTNFLFVGNDLHQESIVGQLSRNASFTHITFAAVEVWPTNMQLWDEWEIVYHGGNTEEAESFYYEHKVDMDEGAELLWPQKDTLYELMTERAMLTHAVFEAEYQNNPRDPSKCEFDDSKLDLTTIGYDDLDLDNLKHVRIGYLDPAKGIETKKHDYPAIIDLIYVFAHRKAYIDCEMTKEPVHKRVAKIAARHKAHPYLAFGCEANGFQSLVGEQLMAACPLLNVVPIENYGVHKNTRISRLNIWLDRSFFRMKRRCKHTQVLRTQLLQHPHADHDDGPDGLEGAVRVLTQLVNLYNEDEPVGEADGLGNNLCDAFW